MAHLQPKSKEGLQHKKEAGFVERSAKVNRTRNDENPTNAEVASPASQASGHDDEGGSWQFKFVLGVIGAGVLLLMLKAIGLF